MITVDVKTSDKLNKKLRELSVIRAQCKIGFFQESRYPDGTSVAYVAMLNELGIHNPRRPFLKRTARHNIRKWMNGIANNIKRGGMSKKNVINAYRKAGVVAVGDVKKTIKSWEPGGNAPATVEAKKRRGRTGRNLVAINPQTVLIDTGQMISSVAYKVEG